MKRTILFTLILLCSSAWAVAQSTPSSGDHADKDQVKREMHTSETVIRGCLNGSADSYTLTDSSGTQYQLQGNTSKLSSRVNTQVEIRGTPSGTPGTGTQGTGTATTQGSVPSFNVMQVKKIAGSCPAKK